MNILLFTNLFPNPIDRDRGVFTLQLAKQLAKEHNLTVICPLPWFPKNSVFSRFTKWYIHSQVPSYYQIEGVNVYSPKYPMLPKVSEALHAKFMRLSIKRLIENLHSHSNFDVINSHWLYPDSVAVDTVARSLNIPHIATGLGCDVNHDLFDKNKRTAILEMIQNANKITVVSNDLKRVLMDQSVPDSKIFTIANGVDLTQFKPLNRNECRKQLGISGEKKIILYVGRLSEEKNCSRLIRAFAQLETTKDVDLYLVGDGPLRNDLETLARSSSKSDRIHFVGQIEHQLISIWMGASDYFCLPSIREGCPNVVLESLGCGRPVLASNIGGIPDMVQQNAGILFNPLEIDEISKTFELALDTEWEPKLIGQSIKHLTWRNAAKKYLSVFSSATEKL